MATDFNEFLNLLRSKNIVIYGTGNICVNVLNSLNSKGIRPRMIVDSPEKKGQMFNGYCINDVEVLRGLDDSLIAIIASETDNAIFDLLNEISCIDIVLNYDLVLSLDNYRRSYSQCGEDMIVDFFFTMIGKRKIKYFDLGANDPININNTFYFYENGSEGILVEPNTALTDRAGIFRSRDTVLNAGVGAEEGVLQYYILDANTLNTCSKEDAEKCVQLGHKLLDVKDIPIIGINQLLRDYGKPDFMSLDVEGIDFDILRVLDFDNYAPTCICIETAEYFGGKRSDFDELNTFLAQKGYITFGDTFINTIYVKKDVLSNVINL